MSSSADTTRAKADEIAAAGVASAAQDGRSATAISPLDLIEIADKQAARDSISTADATGRSVNTLLGRRAKAAFGRTTS